MSNLENAKVGDYLYNYKYPNYYTYGGVQKSKIERETKTLFILENGKRIKKKNGIEAGTHTIWEDAEYWQLEDKKLCLDVINRSIEAQMKGAKERLGRLYNETVIVNLYEEYLANGRKLKK